jgi:hypothetical protein
MSGIVPVSTKVLGPESLLGRTVTFQTSCVAVDDVGVGLIDVESTS